MDDRLEAAYIAGRRALASEILGKMAAELDEDDLAGNAARYLVEIEEARAALRLVCAEFGDDEDYPSNLHLKDVIEKHLLPYLRRSVW